jgi:hypothetical protein
MSSVEHKREVSRRAEPLHGPQQYTGPQKIYRVEYNKKSLHLNTTSKRIPATADVYMFEAPLPPPHIVLQHCVC